MSVSGAMPRSRSTTMPHRTSPMVLARLLPLLAAVLADPAAAQPAATGSAYDGTWSITLNCPSLESRQGPVQGYEFSFPATIAAGKLVARHGSEGAPSSLAYEGQVADDGTITIRASGVTGPSIYAIGKVAQGTPYTYTLRGRLDASAGTARRIEGRPCTATFSR